MCIYFNNWSRRIRVDGGGHPPGFATRNALFVSFSSLMFDLRYREYYTSTRWRRFILQRVVSKTYLTSESELDTFGNHEL